jgi:hypothetical protein
MGLNAKATLAASLIVLLVGIISLAASYGGIMFAANATKGTPSCIASTSAIRVGHQAATTIASANSVRALARLQIAQNATNTYYVAWGGQTATVANGYQLFTNRATASSTNIEVDSGLNTDFADTGAISVITSSGTTTINLTECTY